MKFIVVKDESFVLKALLLLTYAAKMFAICLPRYQQHHLSLNALLNKVFEPNIM
jgi:hypothetical protein